MAVFACCDACIQPSSAASPNVPVGVQATYTVGLPSSFSPGTCGTPSTCTPSIGSVTVTRSGTTGHWLSAASASVCVAGYTVVATNWEGIGSPAAVALSPLTLSGCGYWTVRYVYQKIVGLTVISISVLYRKKRTTLASDDIPGTYTLFSITDNNTALACTGATSDASIVVSL